jgi:hypothetical protein
VKLEELFEKMHDCRDYLDLYRRKAAEGVLVDERDPVLELETIASLYFPELRKEWFAFWTGHYQQNSSAMTLGVEVHHAGGDSGARQSAFHKFQECWTPGYQASLGATSQLEAAGRKLLTEIMGVANN